MSGEVWDRQIRWTYKRDLYVKLIESIVEIIAAEAALQTEQNTKPIEAIEVYFAALHQTLIDFQRLAEIGPIVLSEGANRTLFNLKEHTFDELRGRRTHAFADTREGHRGNL